MKDNLRVIGIIFGFILFINAILWVAQGSDYFLYKFFAPKYEGVRRETFEQSKSYRQGMVQELQNMMFEYAKATPSQQDALSSVILHRAADVDEKILPSDLRLFIDKLRQTRLEAR